MRVIDGIPEEAILRHYIGEFSNAFHTDTIFTHSPSRGANTEICVLRWDYAANKQFSMNYSRTGKVVIVNHRIKWVDYEGFASHWYTNDQILVPITDPDGVEKTTEFIRKFIDKIPKVYL